MSFYQAVPQQPVPRGILGPYFQNRRYEASPMGQAWCSAILALVSSSAIGAVLLALFV